MSRFLVVVPPLTGHINPLVGVAAELDRRGHEVAWCGVPEVVTPLVGPTALVFPCDVKDLASLRRPAAIRGYAALKFLWEEFLIPLADVMLTGVLDAVDEFRPDVLLVDQQALAGALVADGLHIPWATSATTSSELTRQLASTPQVEAHIQNLMCGLRTRRFGQVGVEDLRFSPHLVIAFTTEALTGPVRTLDGQLRFVGPSITDRPGRADLPLAWLDPDRSLVLVTLGTANTDNDARFLGECVAAVEPMADRVQAVVVDPGGTLGSVPSNVLAQPHVPQLQLLARASAAICHAGHNTVCEALAHAVPLVVAPIRDDQPVVAAQVVDAGAGVRLRYTRSTADHVGRALDAVLTQPEFRCAARKVQESFRAAGGARAAARHLDGLARRR